MKTHAKKGFTLIELMIVISIIGLLSSIVLVALKDAKEKGQMTKAVSEMKSLQQAVELYKNQFGSYPGGQFSFYRDYNATEFTNFVQTNLVANGFIKTIPHSPGYPSNCTDPSSPATCANTGYVIGYTRYNFNNLTLCGGQPNTNYIIFFSAKDKKLNLPIWTDQGVNPLTGGATGVPPYVYCISVQ